jgi:hypothetical protein
VPPPIVIGDDEIFEAHAGGKLMVAAAEVAKAVALATEASDTPV